MNSDLIDFKGLLHPFFCEQQTRLKDIGGLVAHYTSQHVLSSILENGEIWLRSTQKMNDYREIEWGISRLQEAMKLPGGQRFKKALHAVDASFPDKIDTFSKQGEDLFLKKTYSSSFTLHDPEKDHYGRLSMWRAYGSVAIVLDTKAIKENLGSHVQFSPMAYMDDKAISNQLMSIGRNIEDCLDALKALDREMVKSAVFYALGMAQLANKHPGFREEEEWRALWVEEAECDKLLTRSFGNIGGKDEVIYRLSLSAICGGDLSNLVHKVIIGPTPPDGIGKTHDEVSALFQRLGWWPKGGIEVTLIPLRHAPA